MARVKKVGRKFDALDFLCFRTECRQTGKRGRVVRVAGVAVRVRKMRSGRYQLIGYCPGCNSNVYKFGKESSVKQFGYIENNRLEL